MNLIEINKNIASKLNNIKQIITEISNDTQNLSLPDQLACNVNTFCFTELDKINQIEDSQKKSDSFKEFLSDYYQAIKGTYFDYTCQSPLTDLLCDIAEYAAYIELGDNASEEDIAEKALTILMPGVKYSYQDPRMFGLAVEKPSEYLDLRTILKTHLLASDDGKLFLEPVWSNLILNSTHFLNATQTLEYTDEYLERVDRHSEATQALQIAREQKKSIESDQQTLLGQLNLLIQMLNFNSVDGIGKEEVGGSQGEQAIHNFLEYQKLVQDEIDFLNIPALNDELKLLRQMVGIYLEGEKAISSIETCFATRRNRLKDIIAINHQKLIEVSVAKDKKAELLESVNKDHDEKKKALLSNFEAQDDGAIQYSGIDSLPLTLSVLDAFKISIEPKHFDEVNNVLGHLTLESLKKLAENESFLDNLLASITEIEGAVTLCLATSIEKLDIFLPKLLNKFPKNELRYFLMPITNKDKLELIFNNILSNIESLEDLCSCLKNLSREQQKIICVQNESFINSLLEKNKVKDHLHSIVSIPDLLFIVIGMIPKENLLSLIKEKDGYGRTVLHLAAKHPQSLGMILDKLPESDRLNAVKEKDDDGRTVLHLAAKHPQSLGMILDKLPESDHLNAVKEKDNYGNTVLHLAANNPQSLGMILDLYPKSDRLNAVKEKDGYGRTVLHLAANNPQSLGMILDKLPESDRLNAVKEEDRYGNTVLHLAAKHPESLGMILDKLPESDHLNAVKEEDRYGNTVLHLAAKHPESLGMILDLYPKSDRLNAVKEEDGYGRTVLHLAAKHPESLGMILDKLPESDRLNAVKEEDRYGNTVLHLAANNPQSLGMILDLYPKSDRLNAVKEEDGYGRTVLHLAANNPQSLG
ncbi:hypothetical protein L3V86_09210, partial [Thiotrichales bacterium 19S11-10]|nr:hypothetical protein [Thiotrichales bacterium 19S11-10]